MAEYNIFVEGPDDKNFLENYFEYLKIPLSKINFKSVEGWTKLPFVEQFFTANSALQTKNLILFDADNDFATRKADIENTISKLKIITDLYLFPDNASSGSLDTIQVSISNPIHKPLFTCYDSFCVCLSANPEYKIPDIKDKIFTYIDCLKENPRVGKRNFKNTDLWDLSHPVLDQLKTFLLSYVV
jgi:hypothetical protein